MPGSSSHSILARGLFATRPEHARTAGGLPLCALGKNSKVEWRTYGVAETYASSLGTHPRKHINTSALLDLKDPESEEQDPGSRSRRTRSRIQKQKSNISRIQKHGVTKTGDLDDDVRVPGLLRGLHCHGALDQIQLC